MTPHIRPEYLTRTEQWKITMRRKQICWVCVDWIHMDQKTNRLWAVVKPAMKLLVTSNTVISVGGKQLLAAHIEFFFMDRPVSRSVTQSVSQTVGQSVSRTIGQSIRYSVCRSAVGKPRQSFRQSLNQSVGRESAGQSGREFS